MNKKAGGLPRKINSDALKRVNERIKKIQKGQLIFSPLRPVRKFIQLVQQSNDFLLFPSQVIGGGLAASFLLTEFSDDPIKAIYIKDDGEVISFLGVNYLGQPRKLDFRAIQRIDHGFINPEGFSHDWYYVFERLLFDFINLKEKTALKKFIEKTSFSVFPSIEEFNFLLKKYGDAGIVGIPAFYVTNDGTLPVTWKEETSIDRKKIEEINLDFMWSKKERLLDYVKKYEAGELMANNILFINEQMENISDSLVDKDAFYKIDINNRSIENIIKDTRGIEEIISTKKLSETNFLVHYRVYGHFAACCLELFLKIMEKQKIAVCANIICQRYFMPKRKGQKYCGNKECNKQRNAQRSKKSLNKKNK